MTETKLKSYPYYYTIGFREWGIENGEWGLGIL